MISRRIIRNFMTSAIRRSGHDEPEGIPGSNVPFQIHNRKKMVAIWTISLASFFAAPYVLLSYRLQN